MPWVKFSDDWYDDEDISSVSDAAQLMWVKAVSWSARNLTDGLVNARVIRSLTEHLEPQVVAAELVQCGRFTEDITGGYRIANYLKFQPARADVLAKREADRARKSANGRAASDDVPHGIQPEAEHVPNRPGPVPGPVESLSSSVLPVGTDPQPVDDDETMLHGVKLSDVYDRMADLRAEAHAGKLTNPKRWKASTRRNMPGEDGANVRAAIERWDEPAHVIAEVVEGKRTTTYLRARAADPMEATS